MKKILLPGLIAGAVLLALSYALLYGLINFFPTFVEEFYNPVFYPGNDRAILFFMHPFIIGLALAWFWERVKDIFKGSFIVRGIELGLVYAIVATLPSMWITFSAIDVSLAMVGSWFMYGILQATVAGFIFAKMNP